MTTTEEHKYTPRQCKFEDILKSESEGSDAEEAIRIMQDYLKVFAIPTVVNGKRLCFHCGGEVDGLLEALGIEGAVAYRWDIAYGEAKCSGCGWPARGMHYIEGVGNIRNFFLEYLPEHVTKKESKP